ncbi:hypothetical protein IJT93_10690 [bacterium]|nr:hypothetical protein [bacterium]
MQQHSKKKGIVLITTMLSVVLVVMLLSAVVYSNMGSLRLTSNFYDRETALMAADSGMQYAVTRLQKDIAWRAVDKYSLKPAQTKSVLHVEEEDGNVVGTVSLANGRKAAFRIKFNCEDGDSGLDAMKNSSQPLDMVNVSTNNLFSLSPAEAVIADKNGKVAVKNGKPERVEFTDGSGNTDIYPFSIPKQTCRIVVQGLAGTGIRDAEPKDLFSLGSIKGSVTPVCVECYVSIDTENMYADAVTCSGGKLTANSKQLSITQAKGSVGSNIRALSDVNLKISDKLNYDSGKIYAHGDVSVTENGREISSGLKGGDLTNKDSFPEIKWEDVPKAASSSPKIIAGTYVWENVEGSDTPQLKFYEGTYKNVSELAGKTGIPVTLPKTVQMDAKTLSLTISGDTYINGDFVLLSKTENRPSIGFLGTSSNYNPILTSKGEMVIKGTMLGEGSITSESSVTIQGPSVLESTPNLGVSVYSNKDINIVEIDKTTKTYDNSQKDGAKQTAFTPDEDAVYSDDGFVQCGETPRPEQVINYRKDLENAALKYFKNTLKLSSYHAGHALNYYNDIIRGAAYNPTTGSVSTLGIRCNCTTTKNNCLDAVTARACQDLIRIYNYENGETEPEPSSTPTAEPETEYNADNIDEALKVYGDSNGVTDTAAKREQLLSLISQYQKLKYSDLDISGVLYAMGNINIDIKGTLNVTGSIVAYGENSENGNISMNADKIGLVSDPSYINSLLALSKSRQLKKGLYCTY